MAKKRKKTNVYKLDSLREHDKGLFRCMHFDCQAEYNLLLPIRDNVCDDLLCKDCQRDYFFLWLGDRLFTYAGTKRRPTKKDRQKK